MAQLNRIAKLLGLTAGLIGCMFSSVAQAEESCYMVTSSGRVMNLGHLCAGGASSASSSIPNSAPTSSHQIRSTQTQAQPRRPQGSCEDLPAAQRGDCYNNYDQSGTRVGTTIGGNRYNGSGRRVQQGSRYSCTFASQYDSAGRICSRSGN